MSGRVGDPGCRKLVAANSGDDRVAHAQCLIGVGGQQPVDSGGEGLDGRDREVEAQVDGAGPSESVMVDAAEREARSFW